MWFVTERHLDDHLVVERAKSGRSAAASDKTSRSWLWRLGVRNPSEAMVREVSRQWHRCQAGSWRALATEYLVRRGIVPEDAAIESRWLIWRNHLIDYAQAYGDTRAMTAQQWAEEMLRWGGPAKTFRSKLPRPVVAMVWLDILSQEVTAEKIAVLAPLVPKVSGLTWQKFQAWKDVVARGGMPTPQAIHRAQNDAQRARSRVRPNICAPRRQRLAHVVGRELEVARFVADMVADTGNGPTWAEVGQAFDWTTSQSRTAIHALARQGWLRFTMTPRSLRPGPRAPLPRASGESAALVWSTSSR